MRSEKTLAELTAWIDAYATPDAPDAQTLADFLGIEFAGPEPEGQRRRSPDGVEVVKTDDGTTDPWRRYRGHKPGPTWFTDAEVAGWEVITDAPEVPEDIIAAATCLITETGESLQGSRGIARRMADAGLLVGTTPEAPECDREHLPEGCVSITFNGWSDDDLRVAARVVESGVLGASIRAELTNRGEGHASVCASCATELDTARDADGAP